MGRIWQAKKQSFALAIASIAVGFLMIALVGQSSMQDRLGGAELSRTRLRPVDNSMFALHLRSSHHPSKHTRKRWMKSADVNDMDAINVAGIDLGTSNSLIAVLNQHAETVVLAADKNAKDLDGRRESDSGSLSTGTLLPSAVALIDSEEEEEVVLVGDSALEFWAKNKNSEKAPLFVPCIKALLGKSFEEACREASRQGILLNSPDSKKNIESSSRSSRSSCSICAVAPTGKAYPVDFVASHIIKNLIERASNLNAAVMTIPANSQPKQAEQTIAAGKMAGLDKIALLQEPVAAALAYGTEWLNDEHQVITVLDIGAGTTDVSFVESWSGIIEIISTAAANVGGRDLDLKMAKIIKEKLEVQHQIIRSEFELLSHARKAKEALSENDEITLSFEDCSITISTVEFESSVEDIIDQIQECILHAAADAAIELPNVGLEGAIPVTKLVLVGGSSYVPSIRRRAEFITNLTHDGTLSPMEVVARGACVYAGILAGKIKGGMEMNDGGFLYSLHGQTSSQGFPF